jgi:hypothetical protein
MDKRRLSIFKLILFSFLVVSLSMSVMAQGKGRGGGGGGGRGSGSGHAGGPPAGVGVERGIGNSSVHSEGRSDKGRENASVKSGGRSDAGLERARMASSRLRDADRELRDHPNMARNLKLNANDLRAGYQTALLTNPELKFGHYVSATRVSENLASRHPNITRDAILGGLASGRSLGQTLQDLGLSDREANDVRRRAEREIREAKKK